MKSVSNNINIKRESDPTELRVYPKLTSEQTQCLKSQGYPDLVILCGVPGSGKSLLCAMVASLNRQQKDSKSKTVHEWRVANQDKLGKKGEVECVVKRWLSQRERNGAKIGLIIDRCNVSKRERRHWIEMCFQIKKCVCVCFDVSAKVCKERIQSRTGHETIHNRTRSSIDKLVRDFVRNTEMPTEKEGFSKVCTVTNTDDLLRVCSQMFGCLPELIRHFIPTQYFKFPRTPHLWNTGAASRDDLRLDPKYARLYYGKSAQRVSVTEKVDGANLGISLNGNYAIQCQHRGTQIVHNSSSEYSKLQTWLERKSKYLSLILEPKRHILFGEWCQCKHSIAYDNLCDYFLVFDLYDRHSQTFLSRERLERLCKGKFTLTRVICTKVFEAKEEIEHLLNNTQSEYGKASIEGLYFKIDNSDTGVNVHRCKLVRADFIQGMADQHWTHHKLEFNTVRPRFEEEFDICEEKEIIIKNHKKRESVSLLQSNGNNIFYAANMAKSRFSMNLKVICQKLGFALEAVLNCFVIGSRVWGTAKSESDWDMILVTADTLKHKSVFVSVDNIDVYVLDQTQWSHELSSHRFVCWLTLFLPKEAIWKNECPISVGFDPQTFIDKLRHAIDKDCRKLNKFFVKHKMSKVYKTFIHTLRMCRISKEMIVLFKRSRHTNRSANDHKTKKVCSSFIGMINFAEIENGAREEQMQIQMNQSQTNCDVWIEALQNAGNDCLSLL